MAKDKQEILRAGSNEMELVDFRIVKRSHDEIYEGIYGINVAKVREIIKMPKLTELPDAPEFIEGIFDLRGVVIPVVNLAKWMRIETDPTAEANSKVIITEFNNILIGFTVHEAKRIRRISWKDIEPASFGADHKGALNSRITGVTKIENNDVLLILDFEGIVEELGIYHPCIDDGVVKIQQFSGIALTLDDSATARKIVKELLQKVGFTVVEARDGEEGLVKLDELYAMYGEEIEKNLKIIISDVEMPQMDGYHFASRVRNDPRFGNKIPIVFNSSISDHFSSIRAEDVNGDGYVVKFEGAQLYTEIEKAIAKHQK